MVSERNLIIKERLIILSKLKYGEADLILKVINAEGHVYSTIAKSALKSRKRFGGGVLEPTHYISATVFKRSMDTDSNRLSVLQEAQLLDDFHESKTDYDKLSLAFHFVQTVARVAREGDAHIEVFNLLGHALKSVAAAEDLSLLKLRFDLKLLNLQGVLPHEARYAPFVRQSIRANESEVLSQTLEDFHLIVREVDTMLENYLNS